MERSEKINLPYPIQVNGNKINSVVIGRHYRERHGHYMSDELILKLVHSLDGKKFKADSTTQNIEYYASDIQLRIELYAIKTYRLIWLFEGDFLEIIGVINAFRIRKKKKI